LTGKAIAAIIPSLRTGLNPCGITTMIQKLILQFCRHGAFSLGAVQLDGRIEGFLCL
jgi:hypothetical protein